MNARLVNDILPRCNPSQLWVRYKGLFFRKLLLMKCFVWFDSLLNDAGELGVDDHNKVK